MGDLREAIVLANRKAGKSRQQAVGRKMSIRLTEGQLLDMITTRCHDVFDAFYKEQGPVALREAIKELQGAVTVTEKRRRL